MASGVHLYTSFTYAYLSRALVPAESVRRNHPDWTLWAVMVDTAPQGFDDTAWRGAFDHVLDPATIYGDDWLKWVFKHDLVQACTGVKGEALIHLLQAGAEKVVYLDPDIAMFHDLSEVEKSLDDVSIVLTPHQVEPNRTSADIHDNEMTSMQFGIFNLGFLAVRNDENGRSMANWWAGRLNEACYDDVPNGIFTNQKYCDHVPGLFGGVSVLRDSGHNVASWNLSRRKINSSPEGQIRVNGASLLRFYHFTKINSEGDIMTEPYARGQSAVFELWNWYKRAISSTEIPGVPKKYWTYGAYDNGGPIKKATRIYYRTHPHLYGSFSNPFRTGPSTFHAHLQEVRPDLL